MLIVLSTPSLRICSVSQKYLIIYYGLEIKKKSKTRMRFDATIRHSSHGLDTVNNTINLTNLQYRPREATGVETDSIRPLKSTISSISYILLSP